MHQDLASKSLSRGQWSPTEAAAAADEVDGPDEDGDHVYRGSRAVREHFPDVFLHQTRLDASCPFSSLMSRYALSTLSLAPATHRALKRAGYTTSDDLAGVTAELLCNELGITSEEADEILRPRQPGPFQQAPSATAAALLTNGSHFDFDIVPGLPFLPSSLVEICGTPGSGKTNLALSMILRVVEHGDEVLVIDLDGSLPAWRLKRLIRAWEQTNGSSPRSVQKLVHTTAVPDLPSLLGLLLSFSSVLDKMPELKLIVLDGLSTPFRYPMLPPSQRTHVLATIRDVFQRLSAIPIAVAFTTQAATKMVNSEFSFQSTMDDSAAQAIVQSSLGESWLPGRVARVMLAREGLDGRRVAYVSRDGKTERAELEWDQE